MGESNSIIACFYDCDQTLIPEFMQNPMLRLLGVDIKDFWADDKKIDRLIFFHEFCVIFDRFG